MTPPQLGIQGIKPLRQPGFHLFQGIAPQRIDAPGALRTHLHNSALTQQPKVPRDGRPRAREPRGDGARILFPPGQQLDHLAPDRVCQQRESVHVWLRNQKLTYSSSPRQPVSRDPSKPDRCCQQVERQRRPSRVTAGSVWGLSAVHVRASIFTSARSLGAPPWWCGTPDRPAPRTGHADSRSLGQYWLAWPAPLCGRRAGTARQGPFRHLRFAICL